PGCTAAARAPSDAAWLTAWRSPSMRPQLMIPKRRTQSGTTRIANSTAAAPRERSARRRGRVSTRRRGTARLLSTGTTAPPIGSADRDLSRSCCPDSVRQVHPPRDERCVLLPHPHQLERSVAGVTHLLDDQHRLE